MASALRLAFLLMPSSCRAFPRQFEKQSLESYYFSESCQTWKTARAMRSALERQWQCSMSAQSGNVFPDNDSYQSQTLALVNPKSVINTISFQRASSSSLLKLFSTQQRKSWMPGGQISLYFAARNRQVTSTHLACPLFSKDNPYPAFPRFCILLFDSSCFFLSQYFFKQQQSNSLMPMSTVLGFSSSSFKQDGISCTSKVNLIAISFIERHPVSQKSVFFRVYSKKLLGGAYLQKSQEFTACQQGYLVISIATWFKECISILFDIPLMFINLVRV